MASFPNSSNTAQGGYNPYTHTEVPFAPMGMSQAPHPRLEEVTTAIMRSLNQPRTPLLEAFFRVENMDILQNRLQATILAQTGYRIDRQSDEHLVVIMRKVYAEHASNLGDNVAAEVKRLNDVVLGVAVPMVASGVAAYLAYLRDASRLPDPLPRGVHTSVKGTKTYELFRGL